MPPKPVLVYSRKDDLHAVQSNAPRQKLGIREAMALIVGIVIGAGIFKAPSLVAGMTPSVAWMFGAWMLGGILSLIGALCYAELASAYCHAGGDYHFLRRAYGRSVSFLFGWARFSVITTGSIALLAFVFGDYMHRLLPLPGMTPVACASAYAAASILVLFWINLRSTESATTTQSWLTLLEVGGLLLITAAAFLVDSSGKPATAAVATVNASSFGLAMVFVLLTYGGWNEAAYISAEMKGGHRSIVTSLVWSILIITALYLLVNWAYWKGLGQPGMAASKAVAADLMHAALGPMGGKLIALLVVVSSLTSINATIVVGARTSYAIGGDWPVLRLLSLWDGDRDAPVNALRIQCVVALLLVGIGTWTGDGFNSMVEFTAPIFWLFFLLSGISLFVLRKREPDRERPFEVPLYPLVPLLFCGMCAYMLWASLAHVFSQSLGGLNAAWIGVAVLAAGGALLWPLHVSEARQRKSAIEPSRRRP